MEARSLGNTDGKGAMKNVADLVKWGDPDAWKLICKASSDQQGWMRSTKAMEIEGMGCLVQVSSVQINADNTENYRPAVAEAIVFVPGVAIIEQTMSTERGEMTVFARRLAPMEEALIHKAQLARDQLLASKMDADEKAIMDEQLATLGKKVAGINPADTGPYSADLGPEPEPEAEPEPAKGVMPVYSGNDQAPDLDEDMTGKQTEL